MSGRLIPGIGLSVIRMKQDLEAPCRLHCIVHNKQIMNRRQHGIVNGSQTVNICILRLRLDLIANPQLDPHPTVPWPLCEPPTWMPRPVRAGPNLQSPSLWLGRDDLRRGNSLQQHGRRLPAP